MILLLLIVAFSSLLGGLIVAGILVVLQWALGAMLTRRVGVCFGCAELLTMLGLVGFILYKADEVCEPGSRTCIDGGEFFAVVSYALIGSLGLIVIPIILVFTLRLSKWSAKRATVGGY